MLFLISLILWCFLQSLSGHTCGWQKESYGATMELSWEVRFQGSPLELCLILFKSGGHGSGKNIVLYLQF